MKINENIREQEQLHGGVRASRIKSAGDIRCLRIFYDKCITTKFELEDQGHGDEYTNRNGKYKLL